MSKEGPFNKRHVLWIVFAAILAAQVLWAVHLCNVKTNYMVDELYAMDSAHSYNELVRRYINESERWTPEEWTPNAQLKELLVVDSSTSLLSRPFPEIVKRLLTKRPFMGILNVVESVFTPGEVRKTGGIGLNIVLLVLIQLLLFHLLARLDVRPEIRLLAVFMNGFTGMTMSMTMFIRFYLWIEFLVLLILLLYCRIWTEKSWKKWLPAILASDFLLYLALKDSELIFLFGGALIVFFSAALLIRRQWIKAVFHLGLVFCLSLAYVLRYTRFIDVLLHIGEYAQGGGAEGRIARNIEAFTPEMAGNNYLEIGKRIHMYLFGAPVVTFLILALAVFLLVYGRMLKKKRPEEAVSYGSETNGFVIVIAVTAAAYVICTGLAGLIATRYQEIGFCLLLIVTWTVYDRLLKPVSDLRPFLAALTALTVIGSVWTVHSGHILHLYTEDAGILAELQGRGDKNAVLIQYKDESRHELYECINLMPEDAKILPVTADQHKINPEECPDEMLVWILTGKKPDKYVKNLLKAGYELKLLGSTHTSDIYICRKGSEG